jgi:hypothetical protein
MEKIDLQSNEINEKKRASLDDVSSLLSRTFKTKKKMMHYIDNYIGKILKILEISKDIKADTVIVISLILLLENRIQQKSNEAYESHTIY